MKIRGLKLWSFPILAVAGLVLFAAGGGIRSADATTATLAFSPSSQQVQAGSPVTVSVVLTPSDGGMASVLFNVSVSGATLTPATQTDSSCNIVSGTVRCAGFFDPLLTSAKTYNLQYTAGGSAGTANLTITGTECTDDDALEFSCEVGSGSVTINAVTEPTATFTNTPVTPTQTNTPVTPTNTAVPPTATNTRTATPTRTNTSTPTKTATMVIGHGGTLTPTATTPSGGTPPVQTATSFPTNTATATKTATSTMQPPATNTSAAQTHTPTSTNTATNTPSGTVTTAPATATNTGIVGGTTSTPTKTGGAPLPPSTGTGGNFGGTNTVAALFLVAIGLGVSGFAATRVTRKR